MELQGKQPCPPPWLPIIHAEALTWAPSSGRTGLCPWVRGLEAPSALHWYSQGWSGGGLQSHHSQALVCTETATPGKQPHEAEVSGFHLLQCGGANLHCHLGWMERRRPTSGHICKGVPEITALWGGTRRGTHPECGWHCHEEGPDGTKMEGGGLPSAESEQGSPVIELNPSGPRTTVNLCSFRLTLSGDSSQ